MATVDLHERGLIQSARLSGYWKKDMILPQDVIPLLNEAKISFVLVGAYGLAGWIKEPRATQDVDVVVAARQVKKAVKILTAAFPQLEPVDLPVVVRLRDRETQEVAIDVMKPMQQPYREVFRHTHTTTAEGQHYRVPSLAMAIVMKFSAMTSLYRMDADKHQDAHDFILMVQKNPDLDKDTIAELASLIYPEGGLNILELIRKVQSGEKLTI